MMTTPFDSYDFGSVHRESSQRLSVLNSQLVRHSLFISRPSTVATGSVLHELPTSPKSSRPPKPKPKKVELSVGERRRRLEKALETDRLRDERNRQERVEFFQKNSISTTQPFGNRVDRFFACGSPPSFMIGNILKEFELVPGNSQKPGNFPAADFEFPSEEDVLPTEFTRSEISCLSLAISRFVAFHRPSREFPTSLVSRGVFARLLFTLGLVAESRFNRLASLASSGAAGTVPGLGPNLDILDALSMQECLEIFDMHAQALEIFPFPL